MLRLNGLHFFEVSWKEKRPGSNPWGARKAVDKLIDKLSSLAAYKFKLSRE